MNKFNSLNPCMKIEISIDPDTLEYELNFDGTFSVIKQAIKEVHEMLEDPDFLEKYENEPEDYHL